MSADESVSLLHRLSRALREDGTLGDHADVIAVLEAIATGVVDEVACSPSRLVDAAIALGERRRTAGLDVESIIEDFASLRQAIGRVLRELPHGRDAQVEALAHLDVRATLSMRASLLGHSRPQLERSGRWAEARRELVDEAGRMRAGTMPALPVHRSTVAHT